MLAKCVMVPFKLSENKILKINSNQKWKRAITAML